MACTQNSRNGNIHVDLAYILQIWDPAPSVVTLQTDKCTWSVSHRFRSSVNRWCKNLGFISYRSCSSSQEKTSNVLRKSKMQNRLVRLYLVNKRVWMSCEVLAQAVRSTA